MWGSEGPAGQHQHVLEEVGQLCSSKTDNTQPGDTTDNTAVVRCPSPQCLWVRLGLINIWTHLAHELLVGVDVQAAVQSAALQLVQQDVFPSQQ